MTHAAALLVAAIAVLPAFGMAAWISFALARADDELGALVSSGGLGSVR